MRVQDSHEDYLAKEGYVNCSKIKKALESDFTYADSLVYSKPPTDDMILGTCLHYALEYRNDVDKYFTCLKESNYPFPENSPLKKENAEYISKFKQENSDKLVIKEDKYNDIIAAADIALDTVLDIPEMGQPMTLRELLKTGRVEESIYIDDEKAFGVRVKIRMDFNNDFIILDFKKTKSAKPNSFNHDVSKLMYDVQDPFYSHVSKAETGVKKPFYFLAIEIERPYHVQLYKLSNESREYGTYRFMHGINKIKRIQREGATIGYEADKYDKAGSAIVLPQLKFMQDVDYND